MKKTLYGKLAAVLFGLLLLVGVSYMVLTWFATRLYLQEVNQKFNRTLAGHLVSEKSLIKEGRVSEEALKDLFHMLMVINPNIEIYLLDSNGAILAFSAPPGKVNRKNVSLDPIRKFLNPGAVFPILGDDPRDLNRKKVFSAATVLSGSQIEGYLYVVLGGEEYDSVVQMLQGSYILRLSAWGAVASLVFILLAGLFLFNLLTRRLKKLTSVMDDFKGNNMEPGDSFLRFNFRPGGDEIDRLGKTFNEMAERMITQVKNLKQTDRLRRELVSNVSHDLRTPLASLQGYLETLLLKEGTLSHEDQRRFLEIATKHSERLGKLISELFELAKLDTNEIRLHLEPFSLGELVQDVAQKFQLVVENKKIKIQTNVQEDLPFVLADIGLIERVFENLFENAFRYTSEGGTLSVSLQRSQQAIIVQVSDNGCGIPAEDLPYIFDRFYRVEKTRQEKYGGAGLGLAITRRILELHESSITVNSLPAVGATFTFSLPIDQALS